MCFSLTEFEKMDLLATFEIAKRSESACTGNSRTQSDGAGKRLSSVGACACDVLSLAFSSHSLPSPLQPSQQRLI